MRRLRSSAERSAKWTLACCFGFVAAIPIGAAEVGQGFPSVDAFVKSIPQGGADVEKGYGHLVGASRRDWAGLVSVQDPQIGGTRQLVVLTQLADGSYQVAAQGPAESSDGGTGHYSIDEVSISKGSVFVSWSWNWHGCGGGATQQIKFHENAWRVIGAEFNQSASIETPRGYDVGDSASMSHNLLTGTVVIHFKPLNRKAVTTSFKLTPTKVLLDDNFGADTGTVEQFSKYAGC